MVNTFVLFLSRVIGNLVDKLVFKPEHGNGPPFWITTIIAEVVLGFLVPVVVIWFSRRREFRAYAGGASWAGRQQIITALERPKAHQLEARLPSEIRALGVAEGEPGLMQLFNSRPPLDARIAAIRAGNV